VKVKVGLAELKLTVAVIVLDATAVTLAPRTKTCPLFVMCISVLTFPFVSAFAMPNPRINTSVAVEMDINKFRAISLIRIVIVFIGFKLNNRSV